MAWRCFILIWLATSSTAGMPRWLRYRASIGLLTPAKLDAARLMREQKRTMPQIAKALGVSRATLYRHLTLDDDAGERAA